MTAENEFDRRREAAIYPANQGVDRSRLNAQRLATQRQRAFGRELMGIGALAHGQAAVMIAQVYLT